MMTVWHRVMTLMLMRIKMMTWRKRSHVERLLTLATSKDQT